MFVFRKRLFREAIEASAASHEKAMESLEAVLAAADRHNVNAIVAALHGYHAGRGPSLEPLLVLRDPGCAKPLFEALLQLPESHGRWVGVAPILTALLEQREMDPASVCEWVAADAPAMSELVVIGAAVMLLRWRRAAEAVTLAGRYLPDCVGSFRDSERPSRSPFPRSTMR